MTAFNERELPELKLDGLSKLQQRTATVHVQFVQVHLYLNTKTCNALFDMVMCTDNMSCLVAVVMLVGGLVAYMHIVGMYLFYCQAVLSCLHCIQDM